MIQCDNLSYAASVLLRTESFLLALLLRNFCAISKFISILPASPGLEELSVTVLSLHYWLNIYPGSHQMLLFFCVQYNISKTAFWNMKSVTNIISFPKFCSAFFFFPGMDPCWNSSETQVQFPGGMCLHLRCHSSGNGCSLQSLFPLCYELDAFLSTGAFCTETGFCLYHGQHTRGGRLLHAALQQFLHCVEALCRQLWFRLVSLGWIKLTLKQRQKKGSRAVWFRAPPNTVLGWLRIKLYILVHLGNRKVRRRD